MTTVATYFEIRTGEETYWTGAVLADRATADAVKAEIERRLPDLGVIVAEVGVSTGSVREIAAVAISTWADEYGVIELDDYLPESIRDLDGAEWDEAVVAFREQARATS